MTPSEFAKQIDIVVPSSSVPSGAEIAGFPLLVRLSDSIWGFSYSDFEKSGADIAFTDATGEILPHELDTWDPDGESLFWVKIPVLKAGAVVRAYYGSAVYSAADHVSATDVWSGYTGVWHMSEESGTVADSTGHGLDAMPDSNVEGKTSEMVAAEGVVGNARVNQAESTTDYRNRLVVPSYDEYHLGGTFTVSGWFNASSVAGWSRFFSRRGLATPAWEIENAGEKTDTLDVIHPASYKAVTVDGFKNVWAYLAFVFDDKEVRVFSNGKLKTSFSIAQAVEDNGSILAIGGNASNNEYTFYGKYDEARLCGGALGEARIAADYATVADASFLAYGGATAPSAVTVDPSAYGKFLQITAAADAVGDGETVPNFPALVRLSESIDGFHYSDFMEGGADLVFADASGAALPCEIDTWDPDGESLVWVRIPAFSNGVSIYAYWGSGTPSPVPPASTWRDFAGVWHMNADKTTEPDATGRGMNAEPAYVEEGDLAQMCVYGDGPTGKHRRNQSWYDGRDRNRLLVPSYTLGDRFTVSGWFKVANIFAWHRFMTRKNSISDAGWDLEWFNQGEGVDTGKIHCTGDGGTALTAEVGAMKNVWAHLAFVYDGTALRVYRDGELKASGAIRAATDNENPLAIGGSPNGKEQSFEGYYDEVRLGRGTLDAARVFADYRTISYPAFFTFGSVGAPASDPPVMDAPQVVNDSGTLKVFVSMLSGKGTPLVRYQSGETVVDVPLEEGAVTGPQSWTVAVPASLAAGATWSVAAVGVNTSGGETSVSAAERFYTGAPAVAKVSDASENGPVAGVFVFSRADSHGDLAVNYALSGTASAGTDYEGSATGTVTIPDGATSAELRIVPFANAAVDADTTVEASVAAGLYAASSSAATMKIANLPPATKRDYRKKIRFAFPMEFLDEGETLENFPVLVRLSESLSGFSYSDFLLDGGRDMLFTDDSGHPIPSEIDTWNPDGESLVWVCVPSLGKGTAVRMYYGNGADPAGIPLAKWPGYAGVWHMGEDSGTARDSSANALHAVPRQNNPKTGDLTAASGGAVGAARVNQTKTTYYSVGTYKGNETAATRNYLETPDYSSLALGSRFSFSGWFRTTGGTEWSENVIYKKSDNSRGWSVIRPPTSDEADAKIKIGIADSGTGEIAIPDMRNNWVHVFCSFDMKQKESGSGWISTVECYANGELAGSGSGSNGSAQINDTSYPLAFGNNLRLQDGWAYYGQYDELRLKKGAATANWAKAEYLTVADGSFAVPGAAESAMDGFLIFIR